jgi:2-polyprenyl-3-methyl-5-hydroxy-6-metoxy-1,4-benzoquinol methylase
MAHEDRQIDKTHLSCDQAESRGFLHRDYIAHCLRWSHVVKHLSKSKRYATARILDIGCGKETPLIKTLYTMKMTPAYYVGVDMNKVPRNLDQENIWAKIKAKMHTDNFDLRWGTDFSLPVRGAVETPTLITCFEVLEHVTPEKVLGILANIKRVSDGDTDIFISTPCFNGKAAANHINEMTYEFLEALLSQNFTIVNTWGTFASQKDIEPMIFTNQIEGAHLEQAYESLKSYYDSNLLSIIFAPLFPKQSRNAMWHVRVK